MNGKPDEHLDQWVRQSLDRLPDTPPPGTAFDPERLWGQLRPELQKPARSRQRAWWWWAAAACLVAVVLGWFRTSQPQPKHSGAVTLSQPPNSPLPIHQEPKTIVDPEPVSPTVARISRPSAERMAVQTGAAPSGEEIMPSVALATEPRVDTQVDSAVTTAAPKAGVAVVSSPKRRFQVVHLNELQAEEEIRPSPHRSERFVRLGLGTTGTYSPEASPPSISLSIKQ